MGQEIACDICKENCGITHYKIQFSESYHSLQTPVGDIKVCDDCALRIRRIYPKDERGKHIVKMRCNKCGKEMDIWDRQENFFHQWYLRIWNKI